MDSNVVQQAQIARDFLDNEVVKRAFATTEEEFVREWKRAEDAGRREIAWAKIQGLEEVKRQLRKVISRGEYALIGENRRPAGSQ